MCVCVSVCLSKVVTLFSLTHTPHTGTEVTSPMLCCYVKLPTPASGIDEVWVLCKNNGNFITFPLLPAQPASGSDCGLLCKHVGHEGLSIADNPLSFLQTYHNPPIADPKANNSGSETEDASPKPKRQRRAVPVAKQTGTVTVIDVDDVEVKPVHVEVKPVPKDVKQLTYNTNRRVTRASAASAQALLRVPLADAPPPQSLCSSMHGMILGAIKAPKTYQVACDECDVVVKASVAWSCQPCQYDLCQACAKGPRKKSPRVSVHGNGSGIEGPQGKQGVQGVPGPPGPSGAAMCNIPAVPVVSPDQAVKNFIANVKELHAVMPQPAAVSAAAIDSAALLNLLTQLVTAPRGQLSAPGPASGEKSYTVGDISQLADIFNKK